MKVAMARRILMAVVITMLASTAWAQIGVTGKVVAANANGKAAQSKLSDVVIWLVPLGDAAAKTAGPAPAKATLVQKDKEFHPRLLVLPTGSSVEFPNKDPFFHNVFSLFNGKRFDLGLYEAGDSKSVRFDRSGISYIFCNIHPEMKAIIVTVSTPYYAVSDATGAYSFRSVPPGEYEMHIFAEGLNNEDQKKLVRNVTVSADASALPQVELPGRMQTMRHKNKYGKDYEPQAGNPYER